MSFTSTTHINQNSISSIKIAKVEKSTTRVVINRLGGGNDTWSTTQLLWGSLLKTYLTVGSGYTEIPIASPVQTIKINSPEITSIKV